MKASQRIALKMSETREQLNALLAMDELTDDQRADMATFSTRMQQLETEARAAIMAEDVPTITTTTVTDGEDRELRSLIGRSQRGRMIFEAALEHRSYGWTSRPSCKRIIKLSSNAIPLALLETRAVTPAPGGRGHSNMGTLILPGVFPDSCAPNFSAVDMPTVPVGESVYPGTFDAERHGSGTPAENAAAGGDDRIVSARTCCRLSRLQASFFYSSRGSCAFLAAWMKHCG